MLKEKKNIVRLAAFLLAVAAAVYAFTSGVLQLGHKEPGYYDVGVATEADAAGFGSLAHFLVYAEGGSSDIRLALNEAQKAFSAALLRYGRLLNADTLYEGIPNIASLNAAPGTPVQVGKTLCGILADALARTGRGEGYSVFSGALHREWQTLRYLDEPEAFDPLNNPEEAEQLTAIARAINAPDAFTLEFPTPDTAVFTVSEACKQLMAEREIEAPLLDLNLLRDAYLLELVAADLRTQGYQAGYLYSESGYSLWLERGGDIRYDLYVPDADGAAVGAALSVPSPAACCQFTAFSASGARYGYYKIEKDGQTRLRHPGIDARTGGFADLMMTVTVVSANRSLADLGYAAIVLNAQTDQAAADALLRAQPEDVLCCCTLQSAPRIIRTTAPEKVAVYEGSGCTVEGI